MKRTFVVMAALATVAVSAEAAPTTAAFAFITDRLDAMYAAVIGYVQVAFSLAAIVVGWYWFRRIGNDHLGAEERFNQALSIRDAKLKAQSDQRSAYHGESGDDDDDDDDDDEEQPHWDYRNW